MIIFFELELGPPGLLWGALTAILPVPIYVALALWLDRFESEPPWMLLLAFSWGATVAVFFPYIITSLATFFLSILTGPGMTETFTAPLVAPVVEETSKFSVLLVLYAWKPEEFDGIVDGIVYAAMVGLGFAMTENILYYSQALAQGAWAGLAGTFILRGILGPFGHPLYTAMSGIGIGIAAQSSRRRLRLLAPVGGLAVAVTLHFLWNAMALLSSLLGEDAPAAFLTAYALVWVPVFLGFLALVAYSLYGEGRKVRFALAADVSPAELDSLSSVTGRLKASVRALVRGGIPAWRLRREYHQVASELAFSRDRRARGAWLTTAPGEEELRARLAELSVRLSAHV